MWHDEDDPWIIKIAPYYVIVAVTMLIVTMFLNAFGVIPQTKKCICCDTKTKFIREGDAE